MINRHVEGPHNPHQRCAGYCLLSENAQSSDVGNHVYNGGGYSQGPDADPESTAVQNGDGRDGERGLGGGRRK